MSSFAFTSGSVGKSTFGSLEATHHAADPGWVVRHVLQYGAEAEIHEPLEYRLMVRETAERLVN